MKRVVVVTLYYRVAADHPRGMQAALKRLAERDVPFGERSSEGYQFERCNKPRKPNSKRGRK